VVLFTLSFEGPPLSPRQLGESSIKSLSPLRALRVKSFFSTAAAQPKRHSLLVLQCAAACGKLSRVTKDK
jgi:hypothetical protein